MTRRTFFIPEGLTATGFEEFTATDRTAGLWSPTMQHGGPPSALLVRALERVSARDSIRITRVVVELLGPIPVGLVQVRTHVERPGTNIQLVVSELWAETDDGVERAVARGTAWRMRTADTADHTHYAGSPMEPVVTGVPQTWGAMWQSGYLDSVEFIEIAKRTQRTPGQTWARPKIPLVEGEPITPMQRLFLIADIANGIGATLELTDWTFLNTDITVHVFRQPVGEWVGVSAETSVGPDGVGMSAAVLHDDQGPVGRIAQTLLIRARR